MSEAGRLRTRRPGDYHRQRQTVSPDGVANEAEGFEGDRAEQGRIPGLAVDHGCGTAGAAVEEQRIAAVPLDHGPVGETELLASVGPDAETL